MAFRFPLQALLRYRESYERRERLRLQIATRELAIARQQLEEANRERKKALDDSAKRLTAGMMGAELQIDQARDQAYCRRMAACEERIQKLQVLRQSQLEAFQKAQQQRKIVENLREHQFAAYRLEQERRAQQQVDEIFLIRRRGEDSR